MASQKLKKAATTALKDYMGLYEDELLLVLSDDNRSEIGYSLYEAGKKLCHEAFYIEMKTREFHGQEPPDIVAEMMKMVDVVIAPTTMSLTHTRARRQASQLGVRIGTMPGITVDTLVRCMSADPERIINLTEKVSRILNNTSIVRIETKAGTDITFPMKNRIILSSTGVLKNIGDAGNIPSGEVYFAPWEGKSNGVIVIDGSIASIGKLTEPVVVEVVDGYAKKISGDGDEAQVLAKILKKAGDEGRAIAECGIGTNYKAEICGDILEDEKVLGTVHVAFGNNISMGGNIDVPIHIDGIITKPTVYVDDDPIMINGKFVFEY